MLNIQPTTAPVTPIYTQHTPPATIPPTKTPAVPLTPPPPPPPPPKRPEVQILPAEEYSKICNDTMYINNTQMKLSIKDCDGKKVRFLLNRGDKKALPDRLFEFDLRWYQPVMNNGMVASGLYVFKTDDKDSRPFDHAISKI
jgi:hypothetical protein